MHYDDVEIDFDDIINQGFISKENGTWEYSQALSLTQRPN